MQSDILPYQCRVHLPWEHSRSAGVGRRLWGWAAWRERLDWKSCRTWIACWALLGHPGTPALCGSTPWLDPGRPGRWRTRRTIERGKKRNICVSLTNLRLLCNRKAKKTDFITFLLMKNWEHQTSIGYEVSCKKSKMWDFLFLLLDKKYLKNDVFKLLTWSKQKLAAVPSIGCNKLSSNMRVPNSNGWILYSAATHTSPIPPSPDS